MRILILSLTILLSASSSYAQMKVFFDSREHRMILRNQPFDQNLRPGSLPLKKILESADSRICNLQPKWPALVPVGSPNNPHNHSPWPGDNGRVDYHYGIGKYEVSNLQYAIFLNHVASESDLHGLYHDEMEFSKYGGIVRRLMSNGRICYSPKPNFANKPVNFVTWYNALRFINWLQNGMKPVPSTTESGTYDMSIPDLYFYMGPSTASGPRNPSTVWMLPNGNEWVKAAYYEPARGSEYWNFATQSNTEPSSSSASALGDLTSPGFNIVNYGNIASWNGVAGGNVTTVGGAGNLSRSPWGTFDMNGNVYEYTEQIVCIAQNLCGRGVRGGSFASSHSGIDETGDIILNGLLLNFAVLAHWGGETFLSHEVGFRVAAMVAP